MYCNKCGNQMPDKSVFCNICGNKVSEEVEPKESRESHNESTRDIQNKRGSATVMSFLICGLGQLYKGHIAKGITFFIIFACLSGGLVYSYSQINQYKLAIVSNEYNIDDNNTSKYSTTYTWEEQAAGLDTATNDLIDSLNNAYASVNEELVKKVNDLNTLAIIILIAMISIWGYNIFDANRIKEQVKASSMI